jgi:hypothetical protein
MSSFGQNFLQGFFGNNNLRDYRHASRVFTTNAYELKPRFKFLFHVSFTLNFEEIPALRGAIGVDDATNLSYVVKTVDLPKFTIDNETLNQYNRKRVIQTRINYDPVNIVFHDDGGDVVRNIWYNYFSYYYKDPSQKYLNENNQNGSFGASANRTAGFGYNTRDIYADDRIVNDWGYIGESFNDGTSSSSGKPPFFRDIRIFGFDQHKFAEYILINPIITNWQHDQYNYSEGAGIMQNTMSIAYETVKYYSGAAGEAASGAVPGFANPSHYDTTKSSLARPGSTSTIFGQGGLLDAAGGIVEDLESRTLLGAIGAAQKAGTAYRTFKDKDIRSSTKSEAVALGVGALTAAIPSVVRALPGRNNGAIFPTPQTAPSVATPGINPNAN